MRCFFLVFVLLFALGWTERNCNNSPLLCSKPFDTVTYLGAHDSPFLRDASTGFSSFGNQFFSTTTQLDAGVRLLSTQVHVGKNEKTGQRELHVCHSSCSLFDAGPLKTWLVEVRRWMDANPDEVVTLLLVNIHGVDARELEGVYAEANLAHYGYVPPRVPELSNATDPTWPRLEQMIDSGGRLVTFVNPLTPDEKNAPYLLDEMTFVWENKYNVTEASDFSCTPDRPKGLTTKEAYESGRLFLMNHFLDFQQAFGIQTPDVAKITKTNGWEGTGALGTHFINCSNQVTRQPTFVLVDFFNVGPAIQTVDIFNRVLEPIGRVHVTEEVLEGGAGVRKATSAGGRMETSVPELVMATVLATAWIVIV
jgi:hypothetical protein